MDEFGILFRTLNQVWIPELLSHGFNFARLVEDKAIVGAFLGGRF